MTESAGLGHIVVSADLSLDGQPELITGRSKNYIPEDLTYDEAEVIVYDDSDFSEATSLFMSSPDTEGWRPSLTTSQYHSSHHIDLLTGMTAYPESRDLVGLLLEYSEGQISVQQTLYFGVEFAQLLLFSGGDLDGDGLDEVVFPFVERTESNTAYNLGWIHGEEPLNEVRESIDGAFNIVTDRSSLQISGSYAKAALGADLDGDGGNDLLVSIPAVTSAMDRQVLWFYEDLESISGVDSADAWLVDSEDDLLGVLLATGDVDGDGRMDTVLSAPGFDDRTADQGAVMLFYGPLSGAMRLEDAEIRTHDTPQASQNTGTQLALADTDRDGRAEIITTSDNSDAIFSDMSVILLPGK